MKKVMAKLFLVKTYAFPKTEHENLTDPSHDVTDDFPIQGTF